jgi:putative transposase
VTICAYQRQCIFGEIIDGQIRLNQYGAIVAETYQWLCQQYSYLHTDEWIVMPNHFHAIMIIIDQPNGGVSHCGQGSHGRGGSDAKLIL